MFIVARDVVEDVGFGSMDWNYRACSRRVKLCSGVRDAPNLGRDDGTILSPKLTACVTMSRV